MTKSAINCWVCDENVRQNEVTIRGGHRRLLSICDQCDFHFFAKDNSTDLEEDRLDRIRLESAGLEIPSIENDFANGLRQSEPLIDKYIKNCVPGEDILEIGCSYGYFLKAAQAFGVNVYGVEVNPIRARYAENLGIPCRYSIDSYMAEGLKFDKIFLFYTFEYINTPKEYLKNLLKILKKDGSIVLITPNLHDAIKDLYSNHAFKEFFYDDCSVAYYSTKSIQRLIEKLQLTNLDIKIETEQGYSVVNHINWYLNDKPRTTGIVGGDIFFDQMRALLKSSNQSYSNAANELNVLLSNFDAEYKRLIQNHDLGNRIIVRIFKK